MVLLLTMKYGKLPLLEPNEIIAVGDIHGENVKLQGLIKQIVPFMVQDSKNHLIFTGDYCNKGPDTPDVFMQISQLRLDFPGQVFCIEGNHESMLKNAFKGRKDWANFTDTSINQFLKLWDIPPEKLELYYKTSGMSDLLESLLPYYETEQVIITHSPLDRELLWLYGLENYFDTEDDDYKYPSSEKFILDRMSYELKWAFSPEDLKIPEIEKYLICGHQFSHHKRPRITRDRAFIDTGCGNPARPLSAFQLKGKQVFQQF